MSLKKSPPSGGATGPSRPLKPPRTSSTCVPAAITPAIATCGARYSWATTRAVADMSRIAANESVGLMIAPYLPDALTAFLVSGARMLPRAKARFLDEPRHDPAEGGGRHASQHDCAEDDARTVGGDRFVFVQRVRRQSRSSRV